MSLDVYLYGAPWTQTQHCDTCGHEHECEKRDQLFDGNITHNLTGMADAAGIYKHLWRPEEVGVTTAGQLIGPLTAGLEKLRAEPQMFERHNPANGWGSYGGLVRFVDEYLDACKQHPAATIRVSR